MRTWGLAGIAFAAIILGGCAAAPGMKMDEPAELTGGTVVRVQPITLDLLNRLDAAHEQQARKVAEEFATKPQGYAIGVGDVLQVTVWDHPELTIPAGSFRDVEFSGQQVGEDGYIYYPYVGMVKAAGMNVAALRDILTERLSRYIQNPQLDVRGRGIPKQARLRRRRSPDAGRAANKRCAPHYCTRNQPVGRADTQRRQERRQCFSWSARVTRSTSRHSTITPTRAKT